MRINEKELIEDYFILHLDEIRREFIEMVEKMRQAGLSQAEATTSVLNFLRNKVISAVFPDSERPSRSIANIRAATVRVTLQELVASCPCTTTLFSEVELKKFADLPSVALANAQRIAHFAPQSAAGIVGMAEQFPSILGEYKTLCEDPVTNAERLATLADTLRSMAARMTTPSSEKERTQTPSPSESPKLAENIVIRLTELPPQQKLDLYNKLADLVKDKQSIDGEVVFDGDILSPLARQSKPGYPKRIQIRDALGAMACLLLDQDYDPLALNADPPINLRQLLQHVRYERRVISERTVVQKNGEKKKGKPVKLDEGKNSENKPTGPDSKKIRNLEETFLVKCTPRSGRK